MNEQLIIKYKTFLDKKKQQTTYKIDYITKYVEKWLYVVANVPEIKKINFIDCMCNAGVYQDGDLGSSMRVLELFNAVAAEHLDKEFYILLNDYDPDRVSIICEIVKTIGCSKNVHCCFSNQDVNTYLQNDNYFKQFFNCYPKRSANLLFVDPYNFCTVKISVLKNFLKKHYCELLFNVFTSDFVRNADTGKMQSYCKEEGIQIRDKEEMLGYIKKSLKVGSIQHTFSYEFRTKTNNEIYQIMFFTPSSKGLEKLKEALWDTFQGKEFHQNSESETAQQLSIFTPQQDAQMHAQYYAVEAITLLCNSFVGSTKTFKEIELFLIENTLLKESQIIGHVIKPLIKDKRLTKMNTVQKNNYKQDSYRFN